MKIWLEVFFVLLLVGVCLALITENRHPVKTLAWILLLVFVPGVGLVLYYLVGMNKRQRRLISSDKLAALKRFSVDQYGPACLTELSDMANLLWMTNKAVPLNGNDIRVYTSFDPMVRDMMEDLRYAKDHIHLESYLFADDHIGTEIGNILIAKAQEGVKVRVQIDDAANIQRRKFYNRLKKYGVEVSSFLKIFVPFVSNDANFRNHRKLVVIDGRIGYCGGMNIADRYSKGIQCGKWRDTHFRVEGPAASELQTAFLIDWQFSTKQFVCDERYYPRCEPCGNVTMQVASSGPMDEWHVTMQGIIRIITQSHKYVYIESPYFIPNEPVMMALKNAALAGVDVRIIIPASGDRGALTTYASRSYVQDALNAGVRVYFYTGGYMHSKAIVSDDRVSTIGSTNIDVRSFEQNFEINAFFYDAGIAHRLRDAFLQDESESIEINQENWQSRRKWRRIAESFARLFSPPL